MGTESKRKETLHMIVNSVAAAQNQGKAVSKKKMEALLCWDLGVTRRKAGEYISQLIDMEKIKEEEGELFIVEIED